MNPVDFKNYEDYRKGCVAQSVIIGIIILIIALVVSGSSFYYEKYFVSIFSLIFGAMGAYLVFYPEETCKNQYDNAWALMRTYGYDPNKPETYVLARQMYNLNQMQSQYRGNVNSGRTNVNINF